MQLCTFAPKLNKHSLSGAWEGSVLDRSEAWQARRAQKLHELREQDADKDLQGCTFWWGFLSIPTYGEVQLGVLWHECCSCFCCFHTAYIYAHSSHVAAVQLYS